MAQQSKHPNPLGVKTRPQQLLEQMGSVGDDYRCPLCGRIGNGPYALDTRWIGVGYPICTEGDHSCLQQIMDEHRTPNDIISLAIQGVLKPPVTLPSVVYSVIASYFIPYTPRFLQPIFD